MVFFADKIEVMPVRLTEKGFTGGFPPDLARRISSKESVSDGRLGEGRLGFGLVTFRFSRAVYGAKPNCQSFP